jgi:transposase
LVFLDESGFLLQPLRRSIWAPRGQTPIQYAWDRHDRLSAMCALTVAPWAQRFGLYYDVADHNLCTQDVVRFLRRLHLALRRPLLLVCDRWAVHRSAVRCLQEQGCPWLRVEWLPPYAPDLDPVEYVWNQAKYGDLANFIPDDVNDLHQHLLRLLDDYRHDPARMYSFFRIAKLPI